MSVEVRTGTLRDSYKAWRCVSHVANEYTYRGFRGSPSPKEILSFWTTQIDNGHPFLVAIEGRSVVGWADVVPAAWPIHAHVGTLTLGVCKPDRGQGIGARLLTAALDASRARGLERLELAVFADDEPTRRFYAKMGFVREAVLTKRVKFNGRYRDEVLLAWDV